MKSLLLLALVLLSGCQSTTITDPTTKIVFKQTTFLMKQGPKDITVKDGAREITVKTGAKDQTAVANTLIELAQSLK
jgi:hypothetical protein